MSSEGLRRDSPVGRSRLPVWWLFPFLALLVGTFRPGGPDPEMSPDGFVQHLEEEVPSRMGAYRIPGAILALIVDGNRGRVAPGLTAQISHDSDIEAPAERVWPWLVQMGCGRAGFYSIDWLDNAGIRSAREIHPQLQDFGVGGILPARRARRALRSCAWSPRSCWCSGASSIGVTDAAGNEGASTARWGTGLRLTSWGWYLAVTPAGDKVS